MHGLRFDRERRSVPAARRFAMKTLVDWGLASHARVPDVLLCVSELATNALTHGVPPGRQMLVVLAYYRDTYGTLVVEVHDSGDQGWPHVVQEGELGLGGNGLVLVAAVSRKWGVREREVGKVVWCEFPFTAPLIDGEPVTDAVEAVRASQAS